MKVLVTGAKGQLGYDVCRQLDKLGICNVGVDIDDFDLAAADEVQAYVDQLKPTCVIHCAAYTQVDKAEENEQLCFDINEGGSRNLAVACERIGARLIHISTDYVFCGEGTTPFEVDTPTRPLSTYGRSKLAGEQAVRAHCSRYAIVRISWAYGVNGANFVKTMQRLGQTRASIQVVCDQIGSPTYTRDLAVLLCEMANKDAQGTFHATGEGYCSWFEFATEIMRLYDLPCRVEPVTSAEYNQAAKRPLNSRLGKASLDEAGLTRLPDWRQSLRAYAEDLKQYLQEEK